MVDMNKVIYVSVPELDCYLVFPRRFFTNVITKSGGKVPCTVCPRPEKDDAFHRWIDENICLDNGYGDRIERNWEIIVSNNVPFGHDRNNITVKHEEDGVFVIVVPKCIQYKDLPKWLNGAECKGTDKKAYFTGIVEILGDTYF